MHEGSGHQVFPEGEDEDIEQGALFGEDTHPLDMETRGTKSDNHQE